MALTLPIGAVNTTNVDAGTDKPDQARADILDAINKLNSLLANLSTTTGAGVLAVRDANGKLAGDILGNAATATTADTASGCSGNAVTATTASNASGSGSIGKCVENGLRIVRGTVAGDGTISAGSGFTVTRTGTGQYTITFSPAFSATPMTVISQRCKVSPGDLVNTSYSWGTSLSTLYVGLTRSVNSNTPYYDYSDNKFDFIAIGPN